MIRQIFPKYVFSIFFILLLNTALAQKNKSYSSHEVFAQNIDSFFPKNTITVEIGNFSMASKQNKFSLTQAGLGANIKYKKWSLNLYNLFNYAYTKGNIYDDYQNTETLFLLGKMKKANSSFLWNNQSYFHLNYRPDSIFNFEIARDAPKIGYGYQSLFLDQKHSPYTYVKAEAKLWHIDYQFMLNFLSDKKFDTIALPFKRKYMVNHTLSWNIHPRVNFNFYESVVWAPVDSSGNRGIDVNYLDPAIFFRPVEFAIGSPDNAFLGIGLNLKVFKSLYLYSQLLLDEFVLSHVKSRDGWWGNKQALQAGMKTNTLFSIPNLEFLAEVNLIRPFVYAHANNWQNYSHLHQSLGFWGGSNQAEALVKLGYKRKLLQGYIFSSFRKWAEDSVAQISLGNSIFKSYELRNRDNNHWFLQGQKRQRLEIYLHLNYAIIPRWDINLGINTGYSYDFYFKEYSQAIFSISLNSSINKLKYRYLDFIRKYL